VQAMSMMPSTPTPASISSTVSKCSENLRHIRAAQRGDGVGGAYGCYTR